jgi:hypothetical protein
MDQQRHHQYLQTLGICQYLPRDTVYDDVAAEPVVAEAGAAAVAKIEQPVSPIEIAKKAPRTPVDVASLVNLNLDGPTKPAISATKTKIVAPVEEPAPPAAAIEVKFSFWQISEELLVCTAVEGALADVQQMQLLSNILNAIGCGVARLPQMEMIEWPPYPNASGDESEVREFLVTLLNARLDSKPVRSVLLVGEGAANWLLSPDLQLQQATGRVALSEQATALLLPSLDSMIEAPEQKAIAWQTLQSLLPASS